MQKNSLSAQEQPVSDISSSFALLQYEINRVKLHLETHGESPILRERLTRLEDLMETCLSPSPANGPAM